MDGWMAFLSGSPPDVCDGTASLSVLEVENVRTHRLCETMPHNNMLTLSSGNMFVVAANAPNHESFFRSGVTVMWM